MCASRGAIARVQMTLQAMLGVQQQGTALTGVELNVWSVQRRVVLQASTGGKTGHAFWTLERLFPTVQHHVFLELLQLCKSAGAEAALVRFLVGVSGQVFGKAWRVQELLGTILALEFCISLVKMHVVLQLCTFSKCGRAEFALVRPGFPLVDFHVDLQAGGSDKRAGAQLTLVRSLSSFMSLIVNL